MDYTIRVLRKCKEYGFKVYVDPHQDIVSVHSIPCNVSSSHRENAALYVMTRCRPSSRFSPICFPLPSRNTPLGLLTSDLFTG